MDPLTWPSFTGVKWIKLRLNALPSYDRPSGFRSDEMSVARLVSDMARPTNIECDSPSAMVFAIVFLYASVSALVGAVSRSTILHSVSHELV